MAYPIPQDIYDELINFKITSSIMSETKVTKYINRAVWYIEDRLNRKLDIESTITEFYSGDNSNTLLLNKKNINEIISIQYFTGVERFQSGVVSYELTPEGLIVLSPYGRFIKGENNIEVTYKIGGLISDKEKEAIILTASEYVLNEISQITGGGSISVQGWSKNYGDRGMYSTYKEDLRRNIEQLLSSEITGVTGQ